MKRLIPLAALACFLASRGTFAAETEVLHFELNPDWSAARKPAMESADCTMKEATANRIECKRPRNTTGENGYGGQSVTAELEAQATKTRVRITTGKGFYGREKGTGRFLSMNK